MFDRQSPARASGTSFSTRGMLGPLGVAVAALTLAAPAMAGGRGGERGGPLTHFGMLHSPLGGATLAPAPDGSLSISNIGSSGQDGVSISLGHSQGATVGLRVATAGGGVACETIVCKMGRVELALAGSGTGTVQEFGVVMHNLGSGLASIGPHLLNVTCPRVAVACRLNGAFCDGSVFPAPFPPQFLSAALGATGDAGVQIESRAAIKNFTCTFVDGRYVLRAGVPIQVSVAGRPPVLADEIEVLYSIDRGNNQNWLFGDTTIQAAVTSGTATLTELEARLRALGLLARSIGGAGVAGVPTTGRDDDCDLQVSNIGSSGQDGVEIDLRELAQLSLPSNIGINEPIPDTTLHFAQPLEAAAQGTGAQMRLHGALESSLDDVELGRLSLQPLGGNILVHGDMTALGSSTLDVSVFIGGAPAGTITLPNASPLAMIVPSTAGTPKISDFGMSRLNNPLVNEIRMPVLEVTLDRVAEIRPPGQPPLFGDSLRIAPTSSTHSVVRCSTTRLLTAGNPTFVIDRIRLGPVNGGVEFAGIATLPVRGTLYQTVDGLTATASPGTTQPFGFAASLGAVQGSQVTIQVPQSTLMPILSRNILKTYFETGDIPTQDDFSNLIDSYIHRTDDGLTTFDLAVFGFSPQEITAHSRLAGQDVASATLGTTMPLQIAGVDSPSHSSLVTQGCTLHDVDRDGRPDLVRLTFSEPVAFSASLGGAGTPHLADEIVVDITIQESAPIQACAIACLADGLASFDVTGVASVLFDNPHRAAGDGRTNGEVCGETSHFLVDNIGSSGQDGVSIEIRPDLHRPPPPHSAASGFTLDASRSQDDGVIQSFNWTTTGQVDGAPPVIVGSAACDLDSKGGVERQISVNSSPWLNPTTITRSAYLGDQLVAQSTGGSLGVVAISVVPTIPSTYQFELVVADSAALAVPASGVVHTFRWNAAVDLGLQGGSGGGGSVLADRLVVRATSSGGSGGGAGGSVDLDAVTITGRGTVATGKLEMGLTGETILFHNFCPADISGDNNINVTDLLAVIGSWGPCATCPGTPCPADTNRDCSINVTDLLAVIGGWGTCN